jgi:hypothetical protein
VKTLPASPIDAGLHIKSFIRPPPPPLAKDVSSSFFATQTGHLIVNSLAATLLLFTGASLTPLTAGDAASTIILYGYRV